ncbi:hypothetical protein BDF22DRAFT_741588 [Syncephalis plumigaleata]|nr:hypothetical protein BDF22DRAFT_741588 [Syncephalis plumigaleata]
MSVPDISNQHQRPGDSGGSRRSNYPEAGRYIEQVFYNDCPTIPSRSSSPNWSQELPGRPRSTMSLGQLGSRHVVVYVPSLSQSVDSLPQIDLMRASEELAHTYRLVPKSADAPRSRRDSQINGMNGRESTVNHREVRAEVYLHRRANDLEENNNSNGNNGQLSDTHSIESNMESLSNSLSALIVLSDLDPTITSGTRIMTQTERVNARARIEEIIAHSVEYARNITPEALSNISDVRHLDACEWEMVDKGLENGWMLLDEPLVQPAERQPDPSRQPMPLVNFFMARRHSTPVISYNSLHTSHVNQMARSEMSSPSSSVPLSPVSTSSVAPKNKSTISEKHPGKRCSSPVERSRKRRAWWKLNIRGILKRD